MDGKILIIDSGMRNLGGHNFSYTRAVQGALEQKGFEVTVFANKNLAGEIARTSGYHSVFSCGAYDFTPGNSRWRDLIYLYAQSVIYSDELQSAFVRIPIGDPALVFCHTVNDFELIGWNRYLSKNRFNGDLMILMRQTPGFRSCSRLKLLAHPYWRIKPYYLNAIRARLGSRFTLLTDSEPLTEEYARIYRHRIATLPIPVNDHFLCEGTQGNALGSAPIQKRYHPSKNGDIYIGYMGDARSSKGFTLLPGLLRNLLVDSKLKTRFVIQCPISASGSDNEQHPEGVAELNRLAEMAGDRVRLIPEKLSERDYADLFRQLDILLIPYLATSYREATSGIFAESLALAKPVVVPSETWMAGELGRSGAGAVFRRDSIDDLAAKVSEVATHFEEYSSNARRFSSTWSAFHNARKLVDILIRESGLEAQCSERTSND